MFKTVVWASDGSAAAECALPFAKVIAQSSGGRLIVVYVNELRVDSHAALATTIANIEDKELAAVRRQVEALQQEGVATDRRLLTCVPRSAVSVHRRHLLAALPVLWDDRVVQDEGGGSGTQSVAGEGAAVAAPVGRRAGGGAGLPRPGPAPGG